MPIVSSFDLAASFTIKFQILLLIVNDLFADSALEVSVHLIQLLPLRPFLVGLVESLLILILILKLAPTPE